MMIKFAIFIFGLSVIFTISEWIGLTAFMGKQSEKFADKTIDKLAGSSIPHYVLIIWFKIKEKWDRP